MDYKDGYQESNKGHIIGIFTGEPTGTAMPFATYKDNFRRFAQNEGSTTSVNILFGKFDTYLYGDNNEMFGAPRVDPSLAGLANRRARCPSPPSTMTPAT